MATRTSRINARRGFCREFGIVIAQGFVGQHAPSPQLAKRLIAHHGKPGRPHLA
jgi:hypothetical protein